MPRIGSALTEKGGQMMPNRKEYIEILSKTVKTVEEFNEDAPIKISLECIEDILELLKKQDAVKPTGQQGKAYCGACGKRIPLKIGARFCHKCGIPILWEGRIGVTNDNWASR